MRTLEVVVDKKLGVQTCLETASSGGGEGWRVNLQRFYRLFLTREQALPHNRSQGEAGAIGGKQIVTDSRRRPSKMRLMS